jgi:hypothetical protein
MFAFGVELQSKSLQTVGSMSEGLKYLASASVRGLQPTNESVSLVYYATKGGPLATNTSGSPGLIPVCVNAITMGVWRVNLTQAESAAAGMPLLSFRMPPNSCNSDHGEMSPFPAPQAPDVEVKPCKI